MTPHSELARRACRARFRKNHDAKLAAGGSCCDCHCVVIERVLAEACAEARAEERETNACACEEWADSEDRVALLKLGDGAPISAESHQESAFIGRRFAAAIRARRS